MTERGLRRTAVVPRISLIKLWEWAGYQPHIVIGVDEYWQTESAARRLEREIYVDLEQRGLAEGRALTPRFKATLEVFAKAEAEVHGWVSDTRANENGGLLVAERRGQGVRLVRDDRVARIDPVPAGQVAEYAVQALPGVPPAQIDRFSVEPPEPVEETGAFQMSRLKQARSRPTDRARLKQLERGPHTGVHQLYVVARTPDERVSEPITVLDVVDTGRVVVTPAVEHGDPVLTCCSGSFHNLVGLIQGTWQTLSRGAPART